MKDLVERIKKDTGNSDDFIFKEMLVHDQHITIISNEVLTDTNTINDFILRAITRVLKDVDMVDFFSSLASYLPDNNMKEVFEYQEILNLLYSGFAIILLPNKTFAIEVRSGLNRGVGEASDEPTIRGPKDAFNEHFNTNLGLIRRRIKSSHLWMKTKTIGKESKTKVGILYMENIVEDDLLSSVCSKLDHILIDGILDSGYLKERLEVRANPIFPTVLSTERPDRAAMSLLEGKIVILVDNSPYVLIVPSFFIDFFHTADDYYQKPINITFIRIIRMLAFFIAIFIPAHYIAITTHNHDAIPLHLLINFSMQRESVPFPALIEALLMSISFEILRESDTRMPSNMGTAVSILGGLVLGDAAVGAGIVSPIMIIVIAISAISGLVFSSVEVISAVRWWRFIMMIFATVFGMYGVYIGGILLLSRLVSLNTFGKPYLAPFAPIILSEQNDAIIKTPNNGKVKKRNPLLTTKNRIRGR